MKILHLDIETSPLLSAHWGLYDQNINIDSIVRDWNILSISWLWDDEDAPYSMTVKPSDHTNDYHIVKRMHELISKADVICAHNGDAFDIKKFNARAIFHDLPPSAPKRTIDTLKTARRVFKFTSNKMDYIGRYLKLGQKVDTPKGLWMKACFGTLKERREALHTMAIYNEGDVILLKRVYHKLRPYMNNHPNQNLHKTEECCPKCGSTDYQSRGYIEATTTRRRKFQCNSCRGWFKGPQVARVGLS